MTPSLSGGDLEMTVLSSGAISGGVVWAAASERNWASGREMLVASEASARSSRGSAEWRTLEFPGAITMLSRAIGRPALSAGARSRLHHFSVERLTSLRRAHPCPHLLDKTQIR